MLANMFGIQHTEKRSRGISTPLYRYRATHNRVHLMEVQPLSKILQNDADESCCYGPLIRRAYLHLHEAVEGAYRLDSDARARVGMLHAAIRVGFAPVQIRVIEH